MNDAADAPRLKGEEDEDTHVASTQRPKIGTCLGYHIVIQFDHHFAHFFPIDRYFEIDITVFYLF